jgi:hypothetical protein
MSKFTNGLLRSNIHRVVPAPGQQARVSKYSVVYFMRPEDEVLLKRLEGSDVIPPLKEGEMEDNVMSKDWVIRRALGRRMDGNVGKGWSDSEGTEGGVIARARRVEEYNLERLGGFVYMKITGEEIKSLVNLYYHNVYFPWFYMSSRTFVIPKVCAG